MIYIVFLVDLKLTLATYSPKTPNKNKTIPWEIKSTIMIEVYPGGTKSENVNFMIK